MRGAASRPGMGPAGWAGWRQACVPTIQGAGERVPARLPMPRMRGAHPAALAALRSAPHAQAAAPVPAMHGVRMRPGAPVVSLTSRPPRRDAEMRTVMLLPPVA